LLEKSFPKLKDKSLRLQVGLELASLYEQEGDQGATAVVMHSVVDIDPDNVDVLFMAQRVYSELAEDTLNKLAILAPASARMQQAVAEHLINGGDLPHAIEHYKKALQIDSRLPGVLNWAKPSFNYRLMILQRKRRRQKTSKKPRRWTAMPPMQSAGWERSHYRSPTWTKRFATTSEPINSTPTK
jgi:Tfp pilus assembly protein PilF